MASRSGFFLLLIVVAGAGDAGAQSVVSVRSGLLNFSEGAVFINNQPVKQRAGAYPSLQEGSDLLTQSGRVELLLTPSAYFRIGQNSAVRMISSRLTDTKVELLYGSAMLDSTEALENSAITLIFKDRQVHISKPGKYRIDSDPPQFRVFQGTAEIAGSGAPLKLLADQMIPLDGASIVKRFTEGSDDLLDIWSDERHFMIASSLSNAQSVTDPATTDDSQVAGGDLGAYLGYIPPAAIAPAPIAPLAGIYSPYPAGLLGLGYGSYAGMGIYPMYIYSGLYLGAPQYSRRPLVGYPYNSLGVSTLGRTIYGYRPVGTPGGYRGPGTLGGGYRTPGTLTRG
ncbi:MAG TPA: hypothetical protein VG345_08660, partial [Bryobacteraceae bacterium]|nr:hypothetical protein [Bryobacteraceae bacterium]